ncbi:family 20 glycosylhydrolase [Pontiella sulfatireligans]|uniref:Glycoside hydrolase family 20 catalytic domain-containing protein n=1 Tax=Pontiella sulfatireligans TaxID=2750658 RepID=A0A6C2UL16_9BACT|nr:family 20 glycosylhydrolase [Pontiella sulfatireligans]VGO20798.1 hypothetical protein SCARR_02865 [Pontiella sulfatireligans]
MTRMIKHTIFHLAILLSIVSVSAQENVSTLPVRGWCIPVPQPAQVDRFVEFIDTELSKTDLNLLIVRINYNYEFKSHPELAERSALSKEQIKKILNACRRNDIELMPLVNLLGHQSWKKDGIHSLLKVYPDFEENPGDKIHDEKFYCRSYCPLHPEVHNVVFSVLDEIAAAFECSAMHVGMDEVFILGEDGCNRCKGKNTAELFAGEANRIYEHLKEKNLNMYMWGDRLLDGKTTGLGEWAASFNGTHPAIDLISKEIIICDWQYGRTPPTASYFAMKGFNVISCSHHVPNVATWQIEEMLRARSAKSGIISQRMQGVMHTQWGPLKWFLDGYEGKPCPETTAQAVETFKAMYQQDTNN